MKADIPSVKAVTFDLWETLILESYRESAKRTTTRVKYMLETLNEIGVNVSEHQVARAMNETINTLLKIWDQNRDVTHRDQLQYFVEYASEGNVNIKEEWIPKLSLAYTSTLFEIPPQLDHSAIRVLRWLRNQNKHIGLICNTGVTPGFAMKKFLSQEGVANYFDIMTFSDEAGIRKPDPRIFKLTARKLKVKPNETVHIGDNLKLDVWGAKNAGFKAIYLSRKKERDRRAEKDATSLAERAKDLGSQNTPGATPDKTISSLFKVIEAIKELEAEH